MQGIHDGPSSLLSDCLALIGSGILDLALDVVRLAKQFQRCIGDLTLARGVQIKELAPRVCQSADLGHAGGHQGLGAHIPSPRAVHAFGNFGQHRGPRDVVHAATALAAMTVCVELAATLSRELNGAGRP